MKPKEIDNLRKSVSKKTTWILNVLLVFVLLLFLFSAWSDWRYLNKLADKAGTPLLELPNYELSGTYSGFRMKANEKLFMGTLHVLNISVISIAWISGIFLRRRNKRILNYIDELENETNNRGQ